MGRGELAQELQDTIDEQREIAEGFKKAHEDAIAAEVQAEKDEYISQCQSVNYSDVERNPDNYKGTVIQVTEGWFDNVTMRVDCDGDVWYVTYTREEGESRILEDDYITGYGECDGVQSYKTVLGTQITIPSMK